MQPSLGPITCVTQYIRDNVGGVVTNVEDNVCELVKDIGPTCNPAVQGCEISPGHIPQTYNPGHFPSQTIPPFCMV